MALSLLLLFKVYRCWHPWTSGPSGHTHTTRGVDTSSVSNAYQLCLFVFSVLYRDLPSHAHPAWLLFSVGQSSGSRSNHSVQYSLMHEGFFNIIPISLDRGPPNMCSRLVPVCVRRFSRYLILISRGTWRGPRFWPFRIVSNPIVTIYVFILIDRNGWELRNVPGMTLHLAIPEVCLVFTDEFARLFASVHRDPCYRNNPDSYCSFGCIYILRLCGIPFVCIFFMSCDRFRSFWRMKGTRYVECKVAP